VIRCLHSRKQNQCVMNDWQSTSISGKMHSKNLAGEGNTGRSANTGRVRGRARTPHPFLLLNRRVALSRMGEGAMTQLGACYTNPLARA
jgi:hypothetical protein